MSGQKGRQKMHIKNQLIRCRTAFRRSNLKQKVVIIIIMGFLLMAAAPVEASSSVTIHNIIDLNGANFMTNSDGDQFPGSGWSFETNVSSGGSISSTSGTTNSQGIIGPYMVTLTSSFAYLNLNIPVVPSFYTFVYGYCSGTDSYELDLEYLDWDDRGIQEIEVSDNTDIQCYFYNRPRTPIIIIEEDTLSDMDPQDFQYSLIGQSSAMAEKYFTLDDDNDDTYSNSAIYPLQWSGYAMPGIYSLTQTGVSGWRTSSACSSSLGKNQIASNINIAENEIVTCVFTNSRSLGSTPNFPILTLINHVKGNGLARRSDWTMTAVSNENNIIFESGIPHSIAAGKKYTLNAVVNNFDVDSDDYNRSEWSCQTREGVDIPLFDQNSIILNNGENVTCAITNSYNQYFIPGPRPY